MELNRALGTKRGVGRPSKAQPFRSFVLDLLLKEPNAKSLEIVRRARLAGYDGGKSALYAVIATVRPRKSRPLGIQEKIPGEVVRHGFGQADVRYLDGRNGIVNFLVSRLEYSRWVTVSIVPDQGLETLVRALVRHYQGAGGVPFLAAFDRAKPIASRTDNEGQVLEWDPAFAYAMVQIGVGVEVRARRGADRGPGTNLANWIKQAFLRDRSFSNEIDLERQLGEWLSVVNATAVPEAGDATPLARLAEERQRLRPLRLLPDNLALRFPVIVGPRATVLFEGQSYAMSPEAIGLSGVLHLYPDRVVVVAGRHEITHERQPAVTTQRSMGVSPGADARPALLS